MEAFRRHFLAFALLSVILVNFRADANPIQDSLPPLVIDDESPPAAPEDQAKAVAEATTRASVGDEMTTIKLIESTTTIGSFSPPSSEVAKEIDKETKLISYETKFEDTNINNQKQTTTTEGPAETSTLEAASSKGGSSSSNGGGETSTTTVTPTKEITTTTSTTAPTSQQSTESSQTSTELAPAASSENSDSKDINILLANKDDTENDLTAVASPAQSAPELPSINVTDDKKENAPSSELDTPVDTSSKSEATQSGSNNDRFHYNFGGPEKAADETKQSESSGSNQQSDLEGKRDTEMSSTKEAVQTTTTTTTTIMPTAKSEPAEEEQATTTSKPVPSEEAPAAKRVEPTAAKSEPVEPMVRKSEPSEQPEAKKGPVEVISAEPEVTKGEADLKQKMDTTTTTTTTAATTAATPAAIEPTRDESTTHDSKRTSATAVVEVGPKSLARPKEDKSQVEEPKLIKDTSVSDKTSSQSPAKVDSDNKSASIIPTVLAAGALGTALGATVNPNLPAAKKADKPITSATRLSPTTTSTTITTATSTTKVPAGSTRKSSTDKWDRWPPSTTSAPPTRRRPILPSIRRRFRPYNRFSPWSGGAESYSPGGEDFLSTDGPIGSSSKPTSSSTHKPRRRPSFSDSTTKGFGSTASSASPSSNSDDSDDESHLKPQEPSVRRGSGSSNRRRHQPHYHQEPPPSDLDSRRIPHHGHGGHRDHHHHHHHHRHHNQHNHHHNRHHGYDRDDRPNGFGFDRDPYESGVITPHHLPPFRPFRDDFGLFNSASQMNSGPSGSAQSRAGFDLLNPLTWLDEMSKPARQQPGRGSQQTGPPSHIGTAARPSGNRPIPVEGEYSEGRPEPNDHRGPQRPHGQHDGPGRNREDYDQGYQDCRENHGHRDRDPPMNRPRPPYRPERPDRPDRPERPDTPYRPDQPDTPYRPDERPGGRPDTPFRPDERPGGRPGTPFRPDERPGGRPDTPFRPDGPDSTFRPDRPDRPDSPFRPGRPDKPDRPYGDDDTYPPSRPNRPYNNRPRDQTEQAEAVREPESSSSEATPSLYGLRNPAAAGPKRVPSIFSPFESLFGTLDDELFGLRSSFIDSPTLKSSPSASSESTSHTFDAVVSSPKISMAATTQEAKESAPFNSDSRQDPPKQQVAVSSVAESNNNEPMKRARVYGR